MREGAEGGSERGDGKRGRGREGESARERGRRLASECPCVRSQCILLYKYNMRVHVYTYIIHTQHTHTHIHTDTHTRRRRHTQTEIKRPYSHTQNNYNTLRCRKKTKIRPNVLLLLQRGENYNTHRYSSGSMGIRHFDQQRTAYK